MQLAKRSYFIRITVCLFLIISFTAKAADPYWYKGDSLVRHSIYPVDMKQRSKLYNRLWGEHYRNIYCIPVTVPAATPRTFNGGMNMLGQADNFMGLLMEDTTRNLYLVKPLGGSTSFLESQFFKEMYDRDDFEGTYLDTFLGDAYTIINPYTYRVADYLAGKTGLTVNDSRIYYVADDGLRDTVAGGFTLQNRLVNIIDMPDINTERHIVTTGEMLESIRSHSVYGVDKEMYVRSRLYDLLVGDWNKIPENWNWEARSNGDSILFTPIVIDRNHAFSKVDGLLLPVMLSALSLPFITNYDYTLSNKQLKRTGDLALALDKTLLTEEDNVIWMEQAEYIQSQISHENIDHAFELLPPEIANEQTGEIRNKLKRRRDDLPDIAQRYVRLLDKTEVVEGRDANGYNNIKYHTTSFTPIGVYDSDYGASMALYFTYTMYAGKRNPFTYQHRVGYNYLRGFYYLGIFPFNNPKMNFQLDVFIGNPQNFSNFFGFGNETKGYKDESRKYNRVYVNQYTVTPSFHYELSPFSKLVFSTSFDTQKAKRQEDRLVSDYYGTDHPLFSSNYFLDLKASYQMERYLSKYFPRMEAVLFAGWNMNLKDASHNLPYFQASLALDYKPIDRLTLATQLNGKALFNDKYYFYQSASVDLRGFRDNRFIGKQTFYQYTDLRLDMGTLENPFTPIKYGVFGGFDYGRVWYPGEDSRKWHASYGGGLWLIFINKLTTKYSFFGSTDSFRFSLNLTLDF